MTELTRFIMLDAIEKIRLNTPETTPLKELIMLETVRIADVTVPKMLRNTPEIILNTVLNTPETKEVIGEITLKIDLIIPAINVTIGEIILMIDEMMPATKATIGEMAEMILATTLTTVDNTAITTGMMASNAEATAPRIAIRGGATA